MHFSLSRLTVGAVVALALPFLGCHSVRTLTPPHHVVVLGFDGVDPGLVARWIQDLPHIRALQASGTVTSLDTTNPPESPVAWAAFATGTNPGKTGIYDFLKRDPKTYMPDIALVSRVPGKFVLGFPVRRPVLINNRDGATFYGLAGRAGVRTSVLRMPLAFPARPIGNGELLAGLGVPDLRGTWGTFFFFSSTLSADEAGDTEFGGKLVRIEPVAGAVDTRIEGPSDPTASTGRHISVPLHLAASPDGTALAITLDGRTQTLAAGQWSTWFPIAFRISPFVTLHGVSRFYVESIAPEMKLYLAPLNFDPERPDVPVSSPPDFSRRLAQRDGLHKTLGWWNDTWALNEERIDEGVFLSDLQNNMDTAERMTLDVLDHDTPALTVSVFTETDSVSHMFYRLLDPQHPRYDPVLAAKYGNAIHDVYQHMDRVIGEVEARLKPGDTLLVVSDHGFHTWRRGFNTNTWLVENGYMTVRDPASAQPLRKLRDLQRLQNQGSFFGNVDWSHTRAYALGLGQIYLNLQGREGQGIVHPGAEAQQLTAEIRAKLLAYRDPDNGALPVEAVSLPAEIYSGPHVAEAGDLQLAFRDGYRTSWQTALGGIPAGIVTLNLKKWSGDHCSSDERDTKGILFSNRKLTGAPNILDIAPTVLRLLGLPPPANMDGHVLALR